MLLHISDHSELSLQQQIIGQVRGRILSGDLAAETPLPSIRGLAKALQVSVITVQRAYDALLSERLIYSRRGKGFFVTPLDDEEKHRQATQRLAEQLQPIVRMAKADGLTKQDIESIFSKLLQQ